MAKVVDITDKLSFDENPKLTIKGETIEVNSDAATVLKMLDVAQSNGATEGALKMYNLLFNERDREKIDKMNMQFKDLMIVIEKAMDLAIGEDESPGE